MQRLALPHRMAESIRRSSARHLRPGVPWGINPPPIETVE
jgi:hypothetical protein